MAEKWILVIDDDTANLTMANSMLSAEGMRVSCVKSGEAAVKFLKINKPDLILLDVHMPGMDGFETLAAIRGGQGAEENFSGHTEGFAVSEASNSPVIFLTADDDSDTETRGLQAGAMDFIKKPFVPDVLLLRVNHAIELTCLQADLAHEVEEKTKEVLAQTRKLTRLSTQVVMAPSDCSFWRSHRAE